MHKYKYSKLSYILVTLLFTSALFVRCARPAAPVGGPKDTIAPELISVFPANFTTNFKAKEIVLSFNEYLQLKDVQKEVLISPPMGIMPQIGIKGRSIEIKFPKELVLEPNTTYKIDFGRAITDNNEGNPAVRYKYVFSTGDSIESYAVSGKVIDAISGDSIFNAVVLFFDAAADSLALDSTLFKAKKLSITRTDSSGVFIATNLKPLDYKIYAIKDENGNKEYEPGTDKVSLSNLKYNPTELLPFKIWNDPINKQLYASPQIEQRMFMEKTNIPQGVNDVKRLQQYQVQATFNRSNVKVDSILFDSVKSNKVVIEYNFTRDTVNFWIDARNKKHVPDSLNGRFVYIGIDTLGKPTPVSHPFQLYFKVKRDASGNIIKGNGADEKDARTILQKLSDKMYDWSEGAIDRKIDRIVRNRLRKAFKNALRIHKKQIKQGVIARDSVLVWPPVNQDSLNHAMKLKDSLALDSLAMDSLKLLSSRRKLDSLCMDTLRDLKITFKPTGTISPLAKMWFTSDYPVTTIDSARIILKMLTEPKKTEDSFDLDAVEMKKEVKKDTTLIPLSFNLNKRSLLKWEVNAKLEPDANYELMFPSCSMEDLAGNVNDSLLIKFKTMKVEEIGKMTVHIVKKDSSRSMPQYIMNLADSTNKIIDVIIVRDTGRYTFNYLSPKKYKVRFYEDLNANDSLDMGNLINRIESERIANFTTKEGTPLIVIEKTKEAIVEIDPLNLFDKSYPSPYSKKEEEIIEPKEAILTDEEDN
ncbi:MAG: Ig-like domain-containing protein [Rikenellaceae bacterium]